MGNHRRDRVDAFTFELDFRPYQLGYFDGAAVRHGEVFIDILNGHGLPWSRVLMRLFLGAYAGGLKPCGEPLPLFFGEAHRCLTQTELVEKVAWVSVCSCDAGVEDVERVDKPRCRRYWPVLPCLHNHFLTT